MNHRPDGPRGRKIQRPAVQSWVSEQADHALTFHPDHSMGQSNEAFYDFTITAWFTLGADLQIINPSKSEYNDISAGIRAAFTF